MQPARNLGPGPRPAEHRRERVRAILAGGYTAGHVHCMLAVADELRRLRAPGGVEILLCGGRRGPEVEAARAAGYPYQPLWIAGIDRRASLGALLGNLMLPLRLLVSGAEARALLARFDPDVVIGAGGYASYPVVAAAQRAGIPTLIHEANATPGVANRLLARRASRICTGSPAAFPGAGPRRVITGNPARAVATVTPAAARARLGLDPGRPVLLVTGGSLGSPRLNRWVLDEQRQLAERGVQVLWQTGAAHAAACRSGLAAASEGLRPVAFLDDMAAAYGAADLVVSAAGALTVAELAQLGKPALVIPARDVAEDHQLANARELRARGVPVRERPELDEILALLADPAALRALGARLSAAAAPGAARRIAALALELAGASVEPVR